MKNVNKWTEEYLDFIDDVELKMSVFEVREVEGHFKQGYNSAIKNLKKITEQLQKEQITSTVYILREVIKRMEDES